MLDLVWADTAANYYEPRGDLSGPHSRDYDTLLGHGIHYVELYAHGLPGSIPLRCEWEDPHCEGCAKPLADPPLLPFPSSSVPFPPVHPYCGIAEDLGSPPPPPPPHIHTRILPTLRKPLSPDLPFQVVASPRPSALSRSAAFHTFLFSSYRDNTEPHPYSLPGAML